jgi:hypothetical protein
MSNDIEIQEMENTNEWINWIEEAISKKHIKYYEHNHFSNIQEIGFGGFGKVYRANWKHFQNYLALKSFFNLNNVIIKEIVHEVIIHSNFNTSKIILFILSFKLLFNF